MALTGFQLAVACSHLGWWLAGMKADWGTYMLMRDLPLAAMPGS